MEISAVRDTTLPSYLQHESGGKHRVLLLELTDGYKMIKGLEHTPVGCIKYAAVVFYSSGLTSSLLLVISSRTPVGTKVKLSSVTSFNGMFLLDSSCIEISGPLPARVRACC